MSEQDKADYVQFDSMEEMIDWVAEQRAEVYGRELTPEQQTINYGDYAVRFMDGLVIFVYAEPPKGETEDVLEHIEAKDREENMLFCKAFSAVVPDGEYGWLHRSVLWPLPQVQFDIAGGFGWQVSAMPEDTRYVIESAYHSIRATVE